MSNGKLIGKDITPTAEVAPNGVWNLVDQYVYNRRDVWPVAATYVTSGLVLHLDASDTNSYPGSGTTWFDLSPSGLNFSMVGSPSWNSSSGYFSTGPGNYFDIIGTNWTSIIPIGDSPRTICAVVNRSSGSILEHIVHYGTASTAQAYALAVRTSDSKLTDHRWFGSNYGPTVTTGTNLFLSTRYNTTTYPGARFQINDVFTTLTDDTGNLSTGTTNLRVGSRVGASTEEWYGTISAVMIYDRALTDEELLQNYEYFQNRYGL